MSGVTNISKVHNYYGMVEQTGSIFTECKSGYFHTTIFSDIFIIDKNFEIQKFNKKGLIQLISLIPTSYPGHNILTEDIGEIIGEDNINDLDPETVYFLNRILNDLNLKKIRNSILNEALPARV